MTSYYFFLICAVLWAAAVGAQLADWFAPDLTTGPAAIRSRQKVACISLWGITAALAAVIYFGFGDLVFLSAPATLFIVCSLAFQARLEGW